MDLRESPDAEAVETGPNVLLTEEWLDSRAAGDCAGLVEAGRADRTRALLVTVTRSPLDRVLTVGRHIEREPVETVVVNVDPEDRSSDVEFDAMAVTSVERVNGPGDLTTLGVGVTDRLDAWADSDHGVALCFHSVTPLLQYNTLDEMFHFLRILTDRVEDTGAVAHYHLDPSAHDEQTVNRLVPLFDDVHDTTDDA